ncbi:gamma-glutamyltransferase [Thalassotalea sp. ND16A]|uniref:gamma-glutamyltransferase n=1 Tax=Thalassotalea sp. ND16A TaxID=1535422 RepID=UPI00051CC282|nr:gamma-glutamyltransferase [Thalassotalea sp. ND16A]KGJ88124.1 Gamma-glutamyltransferase [Thalassotalea sp. ND16A]
MNKTVSLVILTLCFFVSACSPPQQKVTESKVKSSQAAVAIPDKYGAQVAEDILRAGGNAVDAAVATGFALAVTYIDAGNIGGGGFMLIYMDGEPVFLDCRETAPLAAHRDMFLDDNGNVIDKASLIGPKAAGVPGTVAGFWAAHQRYGKLPWKAVVAPAIKLAEEGFMPAKILVDDIHNYQDRFAGRTNFSAHFAAITQGQAFKQPALAATLKRIASEGDKDFYHGETAKLLVAQMARSGGIISAQDLAEYQAVWREPLTANWRDYQILSSPPPSSGGFGVIQLLKMKDVLAQQFKGLEHNSPQYVHLVAEMEKRVFADRAEYLGDPAFVDIDISQLISDSYIERRALEVNPTDISALDSVGPGLHSPNTTHYSIVDSDGNAVSNTYTINWAYGSGVVVEGAGFLLNNEMDDFSVKPGVPNVFGVVGNVANEIQPGKRMLSSMSPTILLQNNKPVMVIGTPGGSTIFTSVFQTIVNIIDFNMSPVAAAGASRFHHQLQPADLVTQSPSRPLPKETINELNKRGYRVEPHNWEFGDIQVIWLNDGQLQPASDPRDRGVSKVLSLDKP